MKGIILYAPAAVPGGIPWHRPPGQVCRVNLAPRTAQGTMWDKEKSL